MQTLVIHPSDPTTAFLREIYDDRGWTVIDTKVSKKYLKEQIKAHDRIIMLGHGSGLGLFGYGRVIIDSTMVYSLRNKECVFIWCNANVFVQKYNLKGFHTGMIISDHEEALNYNVKATVDQIKDSNMSFAYSIYWALKLYDMIEPPAKKDAFSIRTYVDTFYRTTPFDQNPIILFNQENIYPKNPVLQFS